MFWYKSPEPAAADPSKQKKDRPWAFPKKSGTGHLTHTLPQPPKKGKRTTMTTPKHTHPFHIDLFDIEQYIDSLAMDSLCALCSDLETLAHKAKRAYALKAKRAYARSLSEEQKQQHQQD